MRLEGRLHRETAEVLQNKGVLFQGALLHRGPTHLIFPLLMRENLEQFTSVARSEDVTLSVLFAHKPTKSQAFIREAEALGIGIDVASVEELSSALASGFRGDRIEVSGHKAPELLLLSLKQHCLVSVDSISELKRIADLLATHPNLPNARILLRVERTGTSERSITPKDSKFGISHRDISTAFDLIRASKRITLEGFHHHAEEQDPDYRAVQAQGLLQLLIDAYAQGFTPTMVNIGGGFRQPHLKEPGRWQKFIETIEGNLSTNSPLPTWRQHAYGISMARDGSLQNHAQAVNRYPTLGVEPVLRAILRARSPDGHSLARFITENGFSLTVEPGSALLDNCGVSLVEIIDIKTAESGMNLMVCNTHALNLSQRGKEAVSDPLLIKRSHGSSQKAFSACIAGILCRETDMLSTRNIEFDERPEAGDLLCFLNTAAYLSDFEEASPHQHPKGKKLVVLKRDGKHVLCDENRYFPDLETSYDS